MFVIGLSRQKIIYLYFRTHSNHWSHLFQEANNVTWSYHVGVFSILTPLPCSKSKSSFHSSFAVYSHYCFTRGLWAIPQRPTRSCCPLFEELIYNVRLTVIHVSDVLAYVSRLIHLIIPVACRCPNSGHRSTQWSYGSSGDKFAFH